MKLNGGQPITSYDFLTDPMKIMKSIEHLSPNTQKSYAIAISSIELELELIQSHMAQKPMLRGEVGARVVRDERGGMGGRGSIIKNSGMEDLYNAYFQIMTGLNSRLSVNTCKSESQKANWISQEGIQALRESMRKALPKTRAISKADQNKLLDYLVICLYTLTAPRRNLDYSLMKCSSDMSDKNFNYLDVPNSKFILITTRRRGPTMPLRLPLSPT